MFSHPGDKVCVVSPLGYTGISYYDHCLCQGLIKIGADVTLITSGFRAIEKQVVSYDVMFLYINTYGNRGRFQKGLNYLLSTIRVAFYILRNGFKIVHFQILELPIIDFILFLILKLSGLRIIYTPHDIYSFKGKSNINKLMYRFCNYIIVHNSANKDLLINKCGVPANIIRVVAHGNYNYFVHPGLNRDEARKVIGLPEGKKIVLFFGNIRQGKGLETLISAIKLVDCKEEFILLIAGKVARNYDLGVIKEEINSGTLKNKVILRDHFVNNNLVESYYKSSNVVVVPYEQVYESGVLRYAFTCVVPTILSNLKEFSEFAVDGKNCLIFKAGNPVDLADKLKAILENENMAQDIALNAKKLADEEWDWERIAIRTKEIYDTLS